MHAHGTTEVHGGCWGWESLRSTWTEGLASGQVQVIAIGSRQPLADLPNVPLMRDLAQTEEARQIIDAGIIDAGEYYRSFALPPGVPAERVAAMRAAFAATLQDPELVVEAVRANLVINPRPADEVTQSVQGLFALPPDVVDKLRSALTS